MWKKINLVFDAFIIGMLFEYTLRVEVSVFPISIAILLLLSICLDIFWLDKLDIKKTKLIGEIEVRTKEIILNNEKIATTVPKPWMVHEAGQDPLHMLWYVHLVHFEDLCNSTNPIREVVSDEFDSYEEALKDAISQINDANVEKV